MTTLTVHTPTHVAAPRGAWIAAAAFARLLQLFAVHRRDRAERRERTLREDDAARLRRYAQQMMEQDPRFAADLFAAADRAERVEIVAR